jgi:hypothetical protein
MDSENQTSGENSERYFAFVFLGTGAIVCGGVIGWMILQMIH